MLEEQNKVTFRRYVEEVSNEGNLALVDEIFDSYISHQSDGRTEERGPEDVKRFIGEFRQAFPDFRSTIEYQVAEGDMVVPAGGLAAPIKASSGASLPPANRLR